MGLSGYLACLRLAKVIQDPVFKTMEWGCSVDKDICQKEKKSDNLSLIPETQMAEELTLSSCPLTFTHVSWQVHLQHHIPPCVCVSTWIGTGQLNLQLQYHLSIFFALVFGHLQKFGKILVLWSVLKILPTEAVLASRAVWILTTGIRSGEEFPPC